MDRETLMKHLGLKEIDLPVCPIDFNDPSRLRTLAEERGRGVSMETADALVAARGGYQKLYGDLVPKKPLIGR